MSTFQYSTAFACTPEQLWPYLEEPEKLKQWMTGLVEDRAVTEGPLRVGSRFKMSIREGRRVSEYDGEIAAYDRPQRIEVKMTGGSFKPGTEVHADYRLVAEGVARTRLDYECRFVTDQLFMKLMGFLFKWFGKLQVKRFFANLRKLVEDRAAVAS